MAWIVADSFDYYGSTSDLNHSVWDSAPSVGNFVAGRFGAPPTYAYSAQSFDNLHKNFPGNEVTVYVTLAHFRNGALQAPGSAVVESYFILKDGGFGGTAQVTIVTMSDGSIVLKRGDQNSATWLAQYSGAFLASLWTHFQIAVTIDPTNGVFTVRKNGSPSASFTASGLNTRSTANSFANAITLGTSSGGAASNFWDDILIYGASGAAPNTWVGDVRGVCLPACADTAQKVFVPAVTAPTVVYTDGANGLANYTPAANRIFFSQPWSPSRSGAVGRISFNLSSAPAAGSFQAAIYDGNGPGGQPGNLLGTAPALTNPGSGQLNSVPTATIPVVAGRRYYSAMFANMVINPNGWNLSGSSFVQDASFASGYPAVAATTLVSISGARAWTEVAILGNNAYNCSETQANGDTDYVSSTNVGDEDLYSLAPVGFVPAAIIGVVSKVYIRKSDAGTRQGQLRVKSGSTEVFGTDTAVSSTWQYLSRVDPTDPNTATTWTLAAVNALQLGQKVTL